MLYLLLKALHVAAAITFVGGVLVETAVLSAYRGGGGSAPGDRAAVEVFRRWDRSLTTPAMLTVWALGLGLASAGGWFRSGWLPLKLVFVLALSGVHGVQSGALRRLAGGAIRPRPSAAMLAAVLTCTVAIALLAVAKPF